MKNVKLFHRLGIMTVMLFMCVVSSMAQDLSVSGYVYDSRGEPLIAATVLVSGTSNGTSTDIDGYYTIKVAPGSTLKFSYVGCKPTSRTVDASTTKLDVTLESTISEMDEVVVVGYGTKRKGDVSAAVSSINSDDIVRSTSSTASGAIVGKVAGITARQKSAEPGSSASIQIRNMGAPLYVIDGIIDDAGSFNMLDLNDIENISIIKDGAAAIYGMKAANGVVLVTTKHGQKEKPAEVNINAYMGWQQWTTYPELMNAYEYNYAQAMQKINLGMLSNPADVANTRLELEKWKAGIYNPATGEDYRSFDWKDAYVSNAAPQYNINASVSGGTKRTTYYISMSYINQDAVFKDFNFNRANLTANFNVAVSDKFNIGYSMAGKIEDTNGPALTPIDAAAGDYQLLRNSLFGLLPTYRPYANDNPNYVNYLVAHDSRNLAAMDKEHAGSYSNKWRTVRNTITLEWDTPLKGLKAKALGSYWFVNLYSTRNELGYQEYTYDKANDSYVVMYDKAAAGGAKRSRTQRNFYDINGQFTLDYNNTFGEHHNVSALAGFEFFQRQYNNMTVTQSPVDNPFIDLLTTSENNSVGEDISQTSTASWFFRAGYNYDQKYIIDFSARYDGSWRFPKGQRWGFFPSISAAWRISQESFFLDSPLSSWINNIKLRASYGEVGDDALGGYYPDFAFMTGYNYKQGSSFIPTDPFSSSNNTTVIGSRVKGVPVTTLSWMRSAITDIGIELGFLNNRLSFEFDVFQRRRSGIAALPDDIVFPYESGLSVLPQNLNTDMNVGLDLSIAWNDHVGDVGYFVSGNMTLARRKNGKVYGEKFFNAYDKYWFGGSDRWSSVVNGYAWMYDVIGVFQTQEQIDNYPVNIDGYNNTTLLPGDLIFRDVNGDGLIDDYDRRPLGYAGADYPYNTHQGNQQPLMSLGFSLGGNWKGIDLAADFAGGFMNTWCPEWFTVWGSSVQYVANGFKYNSLDTWHHEDILDPTSPWVPGTYPALRGSANPSASYNGTRLANTFYSKNIRYLRLRNLVVGYTLPSKWTNKAHIKKCRFYFEGTNLFSFDNLKTEGIDPEVSGVQGADYPQHRVYTIGVNLTF